jgi:predicted RND superfamily exporter protein
VISFLLSHRTSALFCLLLLTLTFGWFAAHLSVDPGAESVLPSSGKDLRDLREFNATFGADEVIVVAAHSSRLFTSEGLGTIGRLTEEAQRLPDVARVLSPTNVRDLDGDELGPFPLVPFEKVKSGEWTPRALGEYLAAHPLFGGLLVSKDARTAALLIEVKRVEDDARYRERLVRQIRDLVRPADPSMQFHVAGIPVEKADVADYIKRDQRIFAPLILGLFAAVTLVLYRHPVGAVIPLAVVGSSLIWTLGIYAAAGRSLNPVTSLMTPVILVCSVEGAIHLLNHYLFARSSGRTKAGAIEEAYRLSRVPCFNAAFTTAVGFASLLFLPIPAIHDFGIFTALGVMLAYLLTMVLAPLLLAFLPDFPARVRHSFEQARMETLLGRAVRGVVAHPRLSGSAALIVMAVSLAGIQRIRIETDFIRALRPDAPLARSTRFIDDHLTGVNSLEIVAHGVTVTDPEALERVARFEARVRGLPGIRQVTGYPDLAARVNRALHQGHDAFARLPSGSEAAAELADIHDLLSEQAPADLARFVAPGGKDLRLAARATALDSGASQRLFGQIRDAAREAGLSRVTLTGNFVVLSDLSTSLVTNQVQGLIPAMVVIFGAMVLQFRSLRLGLLSIIPSAAPIVMAYGLMGWTGIPLSVPTAMIAGIAIGMTVDNTIHLLAHFREEFAHQGDSLSALTAMVDACGRAVVYSTIIVSGGFLVGTFSSFRPSVHFAFLTGATLLFGFACEVVLLPLALLFYRPPRRERDAAARRTRAALGISAFLAILAAQAARPALAGSTSLLDQYGRPDDPARQRGAPLLLLYGQPPDLRKMKSWEVKMREKAGADLAVLRAVDARSVKGKKTPEQVNERLRQSVPEEIAVLVDWEGDLARAYSLPADRVSATLLDPEGKVCLTAAGPVNETTLQELLDTLARVREKGACR